jgi:tetratricopeptide (TPR) repeat protein
LTDSKQARTITMTEVSAQPLATLADLIAVANAASARSDLGEALRLWTEARQRFPAEPQPCLRSAELLTRLRRFVDAEAVLDEALLRFPANFWLARAHATVARDLGDETEAYTRFRRLRRAFPDEPTAHSGLVHMLLNLNQISAAEAEAEAALARFPDDRWLHHMYARAADQADDPAAAVSRWTALLVRHPDHEPAYPPLVRALIATGRIEHAVGIAHAARGLLPASDGAREACELAEKVKEAPAELPPAVASPLDLLAQALRADSSGAWPEAAGLWEALIEQHPALPRAYAGRARALLRLGRTAEAEIVLAQARRGLPADRSVLNAWAAAAEERNDFLTAAARFRVLRDNFPGDLGALAGIGRALRAIGRLDEADTAFAEAAELCPGDLGIATEYASIASVRRDRWEAIRRWTQVTTVFPERAVGYLRLADELALAGRVADADAVLSDAATRFQDDLEMGLRWIMSGREIGDLTRTDELHRRFPDLAPLISK